MGLAGVGEGGGKIGGRASSPLRRELTSAYDLLMGRFVDVRFHSLIMGK